MSLPLPWIDRIFAKLAISYGTDFMHRWKGLEVADVKTDWAGELASLRERPDAIAFALANLPDRPPTAQQFRRLAETAPRTALEAPQERDHVPADPRRVADELKRLAPVLERKRAQVASDEWAHRILAAHEAGLTKTPTVLAMARAVADRSALRAVAD